MIQEQKELLIKDLCARLPYGVVVKAQYKDGEGWKIKDRPLVGVYLDGQVYLDCVYTTIDNIKPYLRPMESMTDEEIKELSSLSSGLIISKDALHDIILDVMYRTNAIDWLNKKGFDYRGLIPMGLALPAPEGMYK